MKNEIIRIENMCVGDFEPYALDDFRLNIYEGEIVNLVGLSGSGKTALYSFFLGVLPIVSGKVFFGENRYEKGNYFQEQMNVVCIGQQSTLISKLTVMENIFIISNKKRPKAIINYKDIYHRAKVLFSQYDININPKVKVSDLSKAQCHMIEILRAVENESKLIVIDDVFQSYGQYDISQLINLLTKIKKLGVSVLYECHRIDFMYTISDRFIVLRKGKNIRTFYPEDFNRTLIEQLLIGNEIPEKVERKSVAREDVVFQMQSISNGSYINNLSFKLKKGEIIGFYDLENKANKEIMDIVIGESTVVSGRMILKGSIYFPQSIEDAISRNVGYIPRDMVDVSLVNTMSFKDNLFLPVMKKTSRFKFLSDLSVLEFLEKEYIEELGIQIKDKDKAVRYFDAYVYNSILLNRWYLFKPDLMVCIEPFGQADMIMKDIVFRVLSKIAENGAAIIISSPDMSDLENICDRVISVKSL